ncbi:MAG: hypothetical protein ACXACU_16590 [Candidatus Hodarchaeales archaeon]
MSTTMVAAILNGDLKGHNGLTMIQEILEDDPYKQNIYQMLISLYKKSQIFQLIA